jgi:hypothetical protein
MRNKTKKLEMVKRLKNINSSNKDIALILMISGRHVRKLCNQLGYAPEKRGRKNKIVI